MLALWLATGLLSGGETEPSAILRGDDAGGTFGTVSGGWQSLFRAEQKLRAVKQAGKSKQRKRAEEAVEALSMALDDIPLPMVANGLSALKARFEARTPDYAAIVVAALRVAELARVEREASARARKRKLHMLLMVG